MEENLFYSFLVSLQMEVFAWVFNEILTLESIKIASDFRKYEKHFLIRQEYLKRNWTMNGKRTDRMQYSIVMMGS